MNTFTDEELNIAVCIAVGWKPDEREASKRSCSGWIHPDGHMDVPLTSYSSGRSALGNLHEIEKSIQNKSAYEQALRAEVGSPLDFSLIHATARQRCVAFLRATSKEIPL
jgi:hypothetical protein